MSASRINPQWPEQLRRLCAVAAQPQALETPPTELQSYFGGPEYEELLKLIRKNELLTSLPAGPAAPARGDVVLIPDFMGSELSVDGQPLWLNLPSITKGLNGLKVYHEVDQATETDRPAPLPLVTATGPSLHLYARAILTLARDWNVHVFAYDWRQSIEAGARQLADFLREHNLLTVPLRLVAHGSGGLLARRFVQLYPPPPAAARDNRLVLVGTPNEGTYWAVQLLAGTDKLVRWLDKLDLVNNLPTVRRILSSFPATYELLPPRHLLPEAVRELYERGPWVPLPVRKHLLQAAEKLHAALAATDPNPSFDPASMVAILGCNQPTIAGLEIVSPGEFRYRETMHGDGRVAFAPAPDSGGPASTGLTTYYVDENHANLLRNDLVLKSIGEILRNQRTSTLSTRAIVTRTLAQREQYWHRPIGEDLAGTSLEYLAEDLGRSVAPLTSPQEHRAAEQSLMRAATGESNPTQPLDQLTNGPRWAGQTRKVTIRVVEQPICRVDTDLLMIGRYVGAPLTNRFLALDNALGSWIRRAIDQGLLSGELGKVFYLPRPTTPGMAERVKARAMLLLGMGEEGRYSPSDLRFLMSNATFTAASLGIPRFTAVVLGTRGRAGRGILSENGALLSFLQGVAEGLDRCAQPPPPLDITILARDKTQYDSQKGYLKTHTSNGSSPVPGLALDFREAECWQDTQSPQSTGQTSSNDQDDKDDQDLPAPQWGPRITIEKIDTRYRFTALVDGAVIPVRELDVQPYFPSTLPGRLMDSQMLREQETYGELMSTLLFPLDFQDYFAKPLTFVLDKDTASLPWEMACFAQAQSRLHNEHSEQTASNAPESLGRQMQLARQFRTMLAPKPGLPPPRNHTLRILIIADPAPEPHLQLPGARREGRAVVEILSTVKAYLNRQPAATPIKLDVVERIGEAECDFLEIIALILNGSFDVIHFAGHGVFDPKNPAQQGWVFGQDRVLTAREVFQARHVPRLVFANACFSSVVQPAPQKKWATWANKLNSSLAGIAEAFFERGVRNYLGTGWPVNDAQAQAFAQEFYAQVLTGETADKLYNTDTNAANAPLFGGKPATLGEAIAKAREQIYQRGGSTWGAYQHYGQATDFLLSRS